MIPSIDPTTLPAPEPPPRDNTPVARGISLIVLAVLLFLCGGCSALLYILIPFTSRTAATDALSSNVIFGSLGGVGILLAAVLLWQGIVAAMNRASMPAARALPPYGILLLVFIGAVLLGIAVLALGAIVPYAFPPFHFLAALLPPLALLAYAARRLGQTSGLRALLVSFSWGALGATLFAFIAELVVAVVLLVAAVAVLMVTPNGPGQLAQLNRLLTQVERTQDMTPLLNILSNPWVVVALIVYFAGIIPPIEEGLKALVVAFIDPTKTRRRDALLWGIAAGAGFAAIENMLNSSIDISSWAFLAVLRVGAAIVHVANGANMGLGWYSARVEGKWGRLIIAYLVSMAYHAAWNATAIFISAGPFGTGTVERPRDVAVVIALLGILFLLALAGLAWLVRMIRREREAAPAATPVVA